MKKVLLVKPYRPEKLFVTTPPLGFLAVAAYVRREFARRGEALDLRILDLNPKRLLPRDVVADVLAYAPDVIGMSCLSCEADASRALSATLKRHLPDVPIVLGGPYPSHDPEQALGDPHVDVIVKGEGEETFDELLQALLRGGDLDDVLGIGFRKGGLPFHTPERPFIQDLDALPLPAYDLLDLRAYFHVPRHSRLIAHPEYMTVVSTRGCPYRCTYCHVTMGKKTRYRSAENVVAELELLVHTHGIKEIQWADDIWNLDRRRSKKICDLIVEKGLAIRMAFPNGVRGDLFDDELLDKLKAAGAYMITFAPESGSPRIQKLIEKYAKLDVLKEVIAKTAARGIFTHGFFMVGFPTETEEDMRMTFDFALRSKLNTASFFIVNAHPGTKLYEQAKELGMNVDFKASSHNYLNPNFQLSQVPTTRLRAMLRSTYVRFFTDPARLWRIVATTPRKRQLLHFGWDLVHRVFDAFRARQRNIYAAEGVPHFDAAPELEAVQPYNRS